MFWKFFSAVQTLFVCPTDCTVVACCCCDDGCGLPEPPFSSLSLLPHPATSEHSSLSPFPCLKCQLHIVTSYYNPTRIFRVFLHTPSQQLWILTPPPFIKLTLFILKGERISSCSFVSDTVLQKTVTKLPWKILYQNYHYQLVFGIVYSCIYRTYNVNKTSHFTRTKIKWHLYFIQNSGIYQTNSVFIRFGQAVSHILQITDRTLF